MSRLRLHFWPCANGATGQGPVSRRNVAAAACRMRTFTYLEPFYDRSGQISYGLCW